MDDTREFHRQRQRLPRAIRAIGRGRCHPRHRGRHAGIDGQRQRGRSQIAIAGGIREGVRRHRDRGRSSCSGGWGKNSRIDGAGSGETGERPLGDRDQPRDKVSDIFGDRKREHCRLGSRQRAAITGDEEGRRGEIGN